MFHFQHGELYRMSRLCYKYDICLSVCLSVTVVDCDRIMQPKLETDTTG